MSVATVQQSTPVINSTPNPASNLTPRFTPPSNRMLARILLVGTTACAIISLIPPLRLAGSIALRSIAFLSSTEACTSSWKRENAVGKFTLCVKVAAVTAGVVALSANMPFLIVASLIADTALQVMDLIKILHKFKVEDGQKLLVPIASIMINAFTLAGIVVGSWPLMVTAASISIVAMLAFAAGRMACGSSSPWNIVDTACYIGLAAIGIATAVTTAEITSTRYRNKRFKVENGTKYEMRIYGKDDVILARLAPGEKMNLDLPMEAQSLFDDVQRPFVNFDGPANSYYLDGCIGIDPLTTIIQHPLNPSAFPMLPLANAISPKSPDEPNLEELNSLLNECLNVYDFNEAARLLEKGASLQNIPDRLLQTIEGGAACTEAHVRMFRMAFEAREKFNSVGNFVNPGKALTHLLISHPGQTLNLEEEASHLFYKKILLKMFIFADVFSNEPSNEKFQMIHIDQMNPLMEVVEYGEASKVEELLKLHGNNPLLRALWRNSRTIKKIVKQLVEMRDELKQMQVAAQLSVNKARVDLISNIGRISKLALASVANIAVYLDTKVPYPIFDDKFYKDSTVAKEQVAAIV